MLHKNSGLFSRSAVRPLAPYFCSWVTRKSQLFCVKIICYNPRQNYLRKFSSSCPLFCATKLFPKQCLCGKKTPSPNSMLLPTNVQGSGFFLNTQQHLLSGEGGEGRTGTSTMFRKMLLKYAIFSTVLSKIVGTLDFTGSEHQASFYCS